MALSSLMRLVIVVLILIALAMTSSIAWGTLDEPEDSVVSETLLQQDQ